jgi:chromosome segregation ATPase
MGADDRLFCMNKFTLKELNTLLSKKEAEAERIASEIKTANLSLGQIKQEINNLRQAINSLKDKQVEPVTEHAILRYLERVKNINIEETKNEIMEAVKGFYPLDGEVISRDDNDKKVRFVIKGKQVITVTD